MRDAWPFLPVGILILLREEVIQFSVQMASEGNSSKSGVPDSTPTGEGSSLLSSDGFAWSSGGEDVSVSGVETLESETLLDSTRDSREGEDNDEDGEEKDEDEDEDEDEGEDEDEAVWGNISDWPWPIRRMIQEGKLRRQNKIFRRSSTPTRYKNNLTPPTSQSGSSEAAQNTPVLEGEEAAAAGLPVPQLVAKECGEAIKQEAETDESLEYLTPPTSPSSWCGTA